MVSVRAISTLLATKQPLDALIASIAVEQHGVISLVQLVVLGLSPSGVRSRVARGALHRVHYGVYAVGHPQLTQRGRWMAAVLACGSDAGLSRIAAAHLMTLSDWSNAIHVSAPGRRGSTRPGIVVHDASSVRSHDWTEIDGIRCTSWARTVLDLAATHRRGVAEKAIDRAETLGIFDLSQLEDVIEAAGPCRGARTVKDILGEYGVRSGQTESVREDDFIELCGRFGIERPHCNFSMCIAGHWVRHDFWWPKQRVSVEVDGYGTHGTRRGFRSDRRRDRNLILNTDIALLRFDASEVRHDPAGVAQDVQAILAK